MFPASTLVTPPSCLRMLSIKKSEVPRIVRQKCSHCSEKTLTSYQPELILQREEMHAMRGRRGLMHAWGRTDAIVVGGYSRSAAAQVIFVLLCDPQKSAPASLHSERSTRFCASLVPHRFIDRSFKVEGCEDRAGRIPMRWVKKVITHSRSSRRDTVDRAVKTAPFIA